MLKGELAVPADRARLAFPGGAPEMVDAWFDWVDKAMLEAYGAWGKKSMYGRTFMGVIRKTVLIGPDGKVIRVWPKVKVPGHAEEVLAEVQAAAKGVAAK